jgi:hypothetical protein
MANMKRQPGLLLVALSFIFYAGLLLVPLTPLSMENRMILAAMLVICGEASFWIAALILGKEIVTRLRGYKSWQKRARQFFQERI